MSMGQIIWKSFEFGLRPSRRVKKLCDLPWPGERYIGICNKKFVERLVGWETLRTSEAFTGKGKKLPNHVMVFVSDAEVRRVEINERMAEENRWKNK